MKSNQEGFTISELMIVLVITLLFSGLIVMFGYNFWSSSALQQADQDTLISRLNAGDFLRENIGESSGLITQNGLPDSHVLIADPAQSSGQYWLPLHAIPSNVPVGSSGT